MFEDDRILLVRRGREPQKGLWSIPGGALKLGETLENAVRREVREEAGLAVRVLERVELFERILRDSDERVEYHYVLIDYLCEPIEGKLRPADDVDAAEWVSFHDLQHYEITPGTPKVIEKALRMREAAARTR